MNKKTNPVIAWFTANPCAIASVILIAIMTVFVPNFATKGNILSLLGQMSYLAIATIGLAFVLIAQGNDLSIGSIISFAGVLGVSYMVKSDSSLTVAGGLIITIGVGVLIGILNGFIISYMKINAFMLTLITQMLFEGIALLMTEAKTITGVPEAFINLGTSSLFGIPVTILLMIVILIIAQFILTRTEYGRRLYAAGANPRAARLAGINVEWMLLSAYLINGFLAGVSSVIMICRLGVGSPSAGSNIIMEIMSGAIMGGNSLFGGKGSAVGAVFGALLLCLISNGLTLLGIEYTITMIVKGLIILFAVVVDMLNTKLSAKKLLIA